MPLSRCTAQGSFSPCVAQKERPLPDLLGAVQHGTEIVRAVELGRSRHEAGEDVDGDMGQ